VRALKCYSAYLPKFESEVLGVNVQAVKHLELHEMFPKF
jgi:hypothetical protein